MDKLPIDGRVMELSADADERAAIAQRLQVIDVEKFAARAQARPIKGGVQVSGNLSSHIIQSCVVTFVPVPEEVSLPFDRVFLPGSAADGDSRPGSEVFVDLEGDDLPDYFEGPDVDLTDLLMEVLALGINPYPRAEGAKVPEKLTNLDDEQPSHFAVLEQLKTPRD